MAEVEKTIENVDSQYSEIIVNGVTYSSTIEVEDTVEEAEESSSSVSESTVSTSNDPVKTIASTVEKTIEGVDNSYATIVVNGVEYVSANYVAEESVVSADADTESTESSTSSSGQTVSSSNPTVGENVQKVLLNNTLHPIEDINATDSVAELSTHLVNEVASRKSADTTLLRKINAETKDRKAADTELSDTFTTNLNSVKASVSDIQALIPSQATSENQLADKGFVNSSINTNTAYFKGTYNTLAEIEAITDVTNNDYAFLIGTDSSGNTTFSRYKYNSQNKAWAYEYTLNNSSFTSEQWEAINSGVSASKIKTISESIPTKVSQLTNDSKFVTVDYLEEQISTVINSKLSIIMPIGFIYINTVDINPADTLGFGTWERVASGRALWGATTDGEAGNTIEAGIPDIKGSHYNAVVCDGGYTNAGAIKKYGSGGKYGANNAAAAYSMGFTFQASNGEWDADNNKYKSESGATTVYGKSNTVQPPAYKINAWQRTA